MALPKSVVKLSKNGVTYTSSVDRVNYTLAELNRRAMIDVGRFVTYEVRKELRGLWAFLRSPKSKRRPERYQYWVRKKEGDLILGIENIQKGAVSAWWADQAELGTNGQPKRGILTKTVENNIPTIVEIESQYLSALSDEAAALRAIAENPEGDIGE